MRHLHRTAPSFLVITGRRRVGKTELIKEFMRGKRALYYYVDANKSIEVLMREFGQYTAETLDLPPYIRIDTPGALLEFLFLQKESLIVVFDEFQRFLKIYPAMITELQRFWDMRGKDSHLFLIVSGSSVGMIKKIFIGGEAPLNKRSDTIMTLQPFRYQQILQVQRGLGIKNREDQLDLYHLFGGTIYYYPLIEKFNCKNLDDALDRLVLNDFAPLRREVSDVLIEESGREYATYHEIIAALAEGKSTQKAIADHTHVAATSLSPYLDDLINLLGIVEYRVPITGAASRSKMGRYFLKDNFFRFYGRFIYRNMSLYQSGRYDTLKQKILSEWRAFSGRAFEDMVRELLIRELSGEYARLGSWWNRRGDEIDLLALGKSGSLAVEIKNSDLTRGEAISVLCELERKIRLVQKVSAPISIGVAARHIEGKALLRDEGYFAWDLRDAGI